MTRFFFIQYAQLNDSFDFHLNIVIMLPLNYNYYGKIISKNKIFDVKKMFT